jgi:hypothetical protein
MIYQKKIKSNKNKKEKLVEMINKRRIFKIEKT